MWEAIGSVLKAIASVFTYFTHRSTLKNTEKMQKSKEAQIEVDRVSSNEKAVAIRDVESVRKGLAE